MPFTYRGLKADLSRHRVQDAEVDRQLERLRQQTPKITPILDRPAQQGDELLLDYAGFCDGNQFEGGTAERQTLVLGSGTFIPGFEEQLLGARPGEAVTVRVTFPAQYPAAELAGKAAEFRCTVHEIREKSAYELGDEFAQAVGQCATLEEMREHLRRSLQDYSDERGELDLQDRLIRAAAATLEDFAPDKAAVDAAVEDQMETLRAQLARQGLTVEMYCRFMNTTEDQLRTDARPEAEEVLRVQAAVRRIAELEHLEASQEDIAAVCADICRRNGMTMEQLRPHYDAAFEAAVIRTVLTKKAMQLVRDAASVAETVSQA